MMQIHVSFEDYCGSLSNRVYKISIRESSFIKKMVGLTINCASLHFLTDAAFDIIAVLDVV